MRYPLAAFLAVLGSYASAGAADLLGEATQTDAAIERQVRDVVAHCLDDDARAVAHDIETLSRRDEDRHAAGLPPTGITDDARYLAASLATTRDAQRSALKGVLDHHPDPLIRRLAEHTLESDDAAAANQLLADDRHNRRAAVLNDAVRPLGVFSGTAFLAALNPFVLAGTAVDSVATTAVNLWNYNRLSSQEREALVRYRTLLVRAPDTQDAPEIARAIRRLGTKRLEALCQDSVKLGSKALDDGDLDHARFYLESAQGLGNCDRQARQPLERTAEALARRAVREDAGRWPVDDPPVPRPGEEADDYVALATATAGGDPGAMITAAGRFAGRHPDSELAPSARLVVAVARDLAGHRAESRVALEELARDGSSAGRHAKAVLASKDYSGLEAIDAAERQHTRDTVRYVLLGGKMDGRSAVYSATQLGASGMRAAESLGIFNVIGLLTRTWQVWRHDPVSNQAIIDRGEEFLAREPHSPRVNEVHERLTDAYERAGEYGRALMHYRATADPDEGRIAKLEGKLADQLLENAERGHGNPVMLEGIVRHFSTTKAADKARQRLKDRPGEGEMALNRDLLLENPALLGPDALDLDPRLLDGDRSNGELADPGVTLANGELRLTLANEGGPGAHIETRTLAAETYGRARAAAEDVLYARLLTADRTNPEVGRFERYIPFYLRGELGQDGVSVYPGVKMRPDRSEDPSLYR